jgi:5-formyltetrahydrofolate cyclo-ligase
MSARTQREQRAAALIARRRLHPDFRDQASHRIAGAFLRSPLFYSASRIGCYLAMPDEVATDDILIRAWAASKRTFCPVVGARGERLRFIEVARESTLIRSSFGLLEPSDGAEIDPLDLDVVITPLVAFDSFGSRIGMGAGYYDRTFAPLARRQSWVHPKLVGLAFNCQKVRKIKANPWDIPLWKIITELS